MLILLNESANLDRTLKIELWRTIFEILTKLQKDMAILQQKVADREKNAKVHAWRAKINSSQIARIIAFSDGFSVHQ